MEASRQFGVDAKVISAVVKGRKLTADGYWFTEDESEITKKKIREIRASMHFFGGVIAINPETSRVFWFKSQSEAARQLGIARQSINSVVNGKLSKTKGCWLCYADSTAVEKTRAKFGDKIAEKVEKLIREHL